MTAARVEKFLGARPVISDWMLPENAAVEARNCKLRSGAIVPIVSANLLYALPAGTTLRKTFYRYPYGGGDVWLTFANDRADVVESPVVGDSFNRLYWTDGENRPHYNTAPRILADDPFYVIGVPHPVNPPNVAAPSGDVKETRQYVYTRVTSMGEESAPSRAKEAAGDPDDTWVISGLQGDPDDGLNRPITRIRIYRTVTGAQTAGSYFFVTELSVGATSFNDNIGNAEVVLNDTLKTAIYDVPPTGLDNLTVMPNGFLAASKGRDIYFSTPWQPHSWPANYVISVDADIIAFAVIGTVLFILTNSTPYLATGVRPEAISLSRVQTVAPCVAKRSVVAHPSLGVLYASHNGIMRLTPGGVELATRDIFDESDWGNLVPATLTAALDDVFYTAYNGFGRGFLIDLTQGYVVTLSEPFDFERIWVDRYSGHALVARKNRVYTWDPAEGSPSFWFWRSKRFDMASPVNIGAMQIRWNPFAADAAEDVSARLRAWNVQRLKTPLAPLGGHAVAAVRVDPNPALDDDIAQNRTALAGGPLFLSRSGTSIGGDQPTLSVRLLADKGAVLDRSVPDQRVLRPEAGHKSRYYQFEIAGNVEVQSVALAETGRELAQV